MATQTRPILMTGAALASAAAIVVASPALAPNLTRTSAALSMAQVELTTISDVMSIPGYEWSDVLFGQNPWGGAVNTSNPLPIEPYASSCTDSTTGDGICTVGGISGVVYLALDALFNGNGTGWTPSPDGCTDNCTGGYNTWAQGTYINYLFEPQYSVALGSGSIYAIEDTLAGFSASTQYLLQATIGQAFPALQPVISAFFYGPYLLTIVYRTALDAIAGAVVALPLVGPFAANSIYAYLGQLLTPGAVPYQEGLSGILQYWGNIATGVEPFPTSASAAAAAASRAVAPKATASVASTVEAVASTIADSGSDTPDAVNAEVEAPEAGDTTPAETGEDVTPVSSGSDEGTSIDPVSETTPDETPTETPTETTVTVDSPSDMVLYSTADSTPVATKLAGAAAAKVGKRPVRSAAQRVAKKITSALGGAKAAADAGVSTGGR